MKCCNVEQVRTGGAKGLMTSAYQAKHVAPLLVQYVSEAGKLPPSVATPHIGAVCARPLALNYMKRVCKLAKEGADFGCAEQEEDAVKKL